MERITDKHLKGLVDIINKKTGNPMEPYTPVRADNMCKANSGNYHLSFAYGGVKLVQLCNPGGGERDISTTGYGTKRELYNWMTAFIRGLESVSEAITKAEAN